MNPTLVSAGRPSADWLQYFFWRHPEWWSWALAGCAWAAMLFLGWRHAGHEVFHQMPFAGELACWMLMAAAMMLPLVMPRIWVAAAGSLWTRRHRAIAGFLAGYFAVWLAAGVAAAGLRQATWTHQYAAPALAFVGAALWRRMRMYRQALAACHRTRPLAPVGWRADRDCVQFGGMIGAACVWSCWPLMLACALAGHGLVAMAGGMCIEGAGRGWFRAPARAPLVGTLALAAYYFALAGWGLASALVAR